MATHYFTDTMTYTKPERYHKLCDQQGMVTLQQRKADNFLVRYGMEIHAELTYGQACSRFGQALMHQLACDGKLNNEDA